MNRLFRAIRVVRLRGIGYLWYVFREVVLKTIAYRGWYESRLHERGPIVLGLSSIGFGFLAIGLGIAVNWHLGGLLLFVGFSVFSVGWVVVSRRRSRAMIRLVAGLEDRSPTPVARWSDWPIDEEIRLTIAELARQDRREPAALGWIDNDGRLCSEFRKLPGLTIVKAADAVPRYRFDLSLLVDGDGIVVEKDFRGDRSAFSRECLSLGALDPGAHAPRLHFVDNRRMTIRKSFVPGRTVRDLLVSAGARILSVETDGDPDLRLMKPGERIEKVWERGRRVFKKALPGSFLVDLERQLDQLHRAGVTGFSLTFGNVVVHETTGEPWLIDFDSARVHQSTETLAFRRARDRDRELFNRIYGTEIMTEQHAREILRSLPSGYAPLDLGGGLVTRGFWSVDSGTGRWEYLNGRALEGLIEGKRILDLGSNNGVMPLMMLRAGAQEVFGIERIPELVDACRTLHRVFEWRDIRRYNFHVQTGDMLEVLEADWGPFDLVTSFCSLYYLKEREMAEVAKCVRGLAEHFVVQVKTDTRKSAGEMKAEKSAAQFVGDLLKSVGFGSVRTVGGSVQYSRPILIAQR